MEFSVLVTLIADILKEFDSERPTHGSFQAGIGPFGEPQIVKEIARRLSAQGVAAETKLKPDLKLGQDWAIEFKIARPYGDNGKVAENWTVNLLHPYPGNTSLLGDALKLQELQGYRHKGLMVIGFEHEPAKISLEPLLQPLEVVAEKVMHVELQPRVEETRYKLVHQVHQVLRCVGWELSN